MSKRDEFEVMIGERIQLASTKTSALVAAAAKEVSADRRKTLEDCGLAIALAMGRISDLKAARDIGYDGAARDMNDAWNQMKMSSTCGLSVLSTFPPQFLSTFPPQPARPRDAC